MSFNLLDGIVLSVYYPYLEFLLILAPFFASFSFTSLMTGAPSRHNAPPLPKIREEGNSKYAGSISKSKLCIRNVYHWIEEETLPGSLALIAPQWNCGISLSFVQQHSCQVFLNGSVHNDIFMWGKHCNEKNKTEWETMRIKDLIEFGPKS